MRVDQILSLKNYAIRHKYNNNFREFEQHIIHSFFSLVTSKYNISSSFLLMGFPFFLLYGEYCNIYVPRRSNLVIPCQWKITSVIASDESNKYGYYCSHDYDDRHIGVSSS